MARFLDMNQTHSSPFTYLLLVSLLAQMLLVNAADVSTEPFRSQVVKGDWTENWPDSQGGIAKCKVTAGIWNAAIQAALDSDNAVHLPRLAEPYYLDGPIVLKSNQRLTADADAEIRLKPGINTCMVRNEHVMGYADKPVPAESENADSNITIEGGIWTTLANGDPASNGNVRGFSSKQTPVHGTHGVILLHNVRNVTVRHITVRQSRAYAVQLGNAKGFIVDGLTLDRHLRDGVHVDGPSSDGIIRNVSGDSHDDPVSLTAWEWAQYAVSYGAIHHLLIENVTGAPLEKKGTDAIRLLPGVRRFPDGTTLDCPIHDITLRNITDIRDFKLYDQPNLEMGRDKDASVGVGTLRNIRFENLTFNRPGSIQVHANTDGLIIEKVSLNFPVASGYHLVELGPKSATYKHDVKNPATWVEIFSPDLDCEVRNLQIRDVRSTATGEVEISESQKLRVLEPMLNPDYPQTTPRGGRGKVLWIK